MRIRVVDHYKWNRAKSLALGWLSFASFIVAIGFGGGLEGTEEPPSFFGAFLFLGISWFLFTIKISHTPHNEGEHK
jgi:hypothetical protein